jgi:hypothetical protein
MQATSEAPPCEVFGVKMQLVSERKMTPAFGDSLRASGSVQILRCPQCGATMARTVPPKVESGDGQLSRI